MTIALGILASDGLVIAADTQLSMGYLKTTAGKVTWAAKTEVPPGSNRTEIIVSGAGAEFSIKHLGQEITSEFMETPAVMPAQHVGNVLRKSVLGFHKQHVTPHGKDGSLDVWMIVGATDKIGKHLWVTDRSVTKEESRFGAVGVGLGMARIVMEQMYAPVDTVGAILLASYVIWRVKHSMDGVGDETDIIASSAGGKTYWVSRSQAAKLEDVFQRFSETKADAFHTIFGRRVGWNGTTTVPAQLRKLKREVEGIVASFEDLPLWARVSRTISQVAQSSPLPTTADPSHPQPSPESPGGSGES